MDTATITNESSYPKDIITRLGGPVAVAAACKPPITHGAVCQWTEIPLKHLAALADYSHRENKGVTPKEMRPDVNWELFLKRRK